MKTTFMKNKQIGDLFCEKWNALPNKRKRLFKGECREMVGLLLDIIGQAIDETEPDGALGFYGFGTFTKKRRRSHMAYDLLHGGTCMVETRVDKITFKRSSQIDKRAEIWSDD